MVTTRPHATGYSSRLINILCWSYSLSSTSVVSSVQGGAAPASSKSLVRVIYTAS